MAMRSMTKLFVCFLTVLGLGNVAGASQGTDVGYMFGVKDTTFSSSGTTWTAEAGFMLGAIAIGELSGDIYFRSGGYFAQRISKASSGGADATFTINYLDVPITALYKFNDMLGVFGGLGIGLKVSDSCSGCGGADISANGFIATAQVGLNAKFHPNWAGEIFYEFGLSDIAKPSGGSSVSASDISADIQFIY